MLYYSTIGQLSYLCEVSVLRHFNETAPTFLHFKELILTITSKTRLVKM